MADKTKIEWTDATWNPITGCSVVSPGCTNCYAMRLAGTRLAHHESRAGLTRDTKAGPVWTGEVRFNEQWIDQPLRWKKPRMIFVCAHGDLFAENVPDAWIDRVFAVMALAPQHTFQVLTKRSARMREYLADIDLPNRIVCAVEQIDFVSLQDEKRFTLQGFDADRGVEGVPALWPLPNVWLGVSVEDQKRADERIPNLLATPAAIRWISAEPLLGAVNLEPWLDPDAFCQTCDDGGGYANRCARGDIPLDEQCPWRRAVQIVTEQEPLEDGVPSAVTCKVMKLDWVVVGGESGPGARPMHPDWARSLRDQCAAAGVAFHFKQWGNWLPVPDRDNDDPDWRSNYTDLREQKRAIINLAGGMGFHGERVHVVENVGKERAGRLLDGIEHNGWPQVQL
jgi:protein gp37